MLTGDTPQERAALVVASLTAFLTPFMGAAANVALPSIARDLGLNALELSWVASIFLLAAAVCLVPFGRWADIVGRKRVMTWGILTYGTGSLLSGLAPSFVMLLAARALQGVGGAMMFGTSVAVLTSVFAPARRGAALGINVAAVYLGLSLGPVLGGLLTEQFGWRSIFHVNAVLAAAAATAVVSGLKGDWAQARREPFDVAGSMVYALGLGALMFGFSRAPSPSAAFWILAGVAALVAFIAFERSVRYPVLDVALFTGNRVFAWSNLAALINYAATFAVGFLMSLFLQDVLGLAPRQAGFVLLAQPVVMVLVSPLAGRWSDRVEPRLVASAGMGLTTVGLVMLVGVGASTPIPYILGALTVLGAGFGLFSSPNTNAVMGAVAPASYGVAASALGTMRLGGQMLSMGLAMMVLSVFVGAGVSPSDAGPGLVTATRVAFAAFAGLCAIGVGASMARGTRESVDVHGRVDGTRHP
ncbi:MAG: MFS transporter [Vicinamibacteraceae bacterium]|nr:MFS transporter [Vicinamibacteraceae bacterium]